MKHISLLIAFCAVCGVAFAQENDSVETDDTICEVVEKMPQFPGGSNGLFSFLIENIKYPSKAERNGIEGRVIVQFVVLKDGSIDDIKVVQSVHPDLDAEAVRLIKIMPKWQPGEQCGQVVNCRYKLPVIFKLNP